MLLLQSRIRHVVITNSMEIKKVRA